MFLKASLDRMLDLSSLSCLSLMTSTPLDKTTYVWRTCASSCVKH